MQIVRFRGRGTRPAIGVLEGTHIVEYAGTPFGHLQAGPPEVPPQAGGAAVAGDPVEDRRGGAQLPRARRGDESRRARGAAHLLQAGLRAVRARRSDRARRPTSGGVDYEAELAIVIKKRAQRPARARARARARLHVPERRDRPRAAGARRRSPSGPRRSTRSARSGPCIATEIDPNGVDVETYVNGERRHVRSNTKYLVVPGRGLSRAISAVMTLLPGDVHRHRHARRGRRRSQPGRQGSRSASRAIGSLQEPGDPAC